MISDYKCPNCKRMKRITGMRPVITRKCSCSSAPVGYVRVCWSKLDWSLTVQAMADTYNLPYHTVAAKRVELNKPKGKLGRKHRDGYERRIQPEEIDTTISNSENSRRFAAKGIKISPEWIRRLRLELQEVQS